METVYHEPSKSLVVLTDEKIKEIKTKGTQSEYFKILALPEHFSLQQLQSIVDGKLVEGKCLVECNDYGKLDKMKEPNDAGKIYRDFGYSIKLNPLMNLQLNMLAVWHLIG